MSAGSLGASLETDRPGGLEGARTGQIVAEHPDPPEHARGGLGEETCGNDIDRPGLHGRQLPEVLPEAD